MSTEIEFGDKDAADHARDEYEQYLCSDDDRRLKTVTFASNTPDYIIDTVEADALESKGKATRSNSVSLSRKEREKISDVDGFDQTTTTANWRSAKGVFAREGLTSYFFDAIGGLTDYDDPVEGAEEWVQRYQEGGGRGSARDEGEEDIKEAQQAQELAKQAKQVQSQQCNHAEDECRHGDPEACEFLHDACGFEEEQVDRIMTDDGGDGDDLPGEVYGLLSQLWTKYRAGIGEAKEAAAGINEIRQQHDQDPLAFDELGGRELLPEDIK
jgi:hypothetical protein